jgi:glycosidase
LPDFNFQIQAARDWSVANAAMWAQTSGVDGFRLDAVKHIETSWLLDARARLRAEIETGGQRFYLIGETFTSDQGLIKSYVDPATMLDGQFDFPLRAQLVRAVLNRQGAMRDLDGFIGGNDGFYGPGAIMGTFLGNHDLPRAIHLGEDVPQFHEWDTARDRAWQNQPQLPSRPEPFERLGVAFGLIMTLPGIPLIYYGDEIGMPGAGDPDNRRMMPWSGLTSDQTWLRALVTRLVHVRAAHVALRRGSRRTLGASQDGYVFERTGAGDHVYVALNRGDGQVMADGLPAGAYHDEVGGADVTAPLSMPPRSVMVLVPR